MVSPQNVNAQTVVVQNNNGTSTTTNNINPNVRYINGIPSTQDIGGVDVDQPISYYATPVNPIYTSIVFTNYNPFPVTVVYEYGNLTGKSDNHWSVVGTIVLPAATNDKYPSKEVKTGKNFSGKLDIQTITRRIGN